MPRLRFAFDDAAVVADDLGDQRQAEARLPVGLVVTNGSNRCGSRSSGTPGPLSLTQNSSGSDTRVLEPGSYSRTPGRNAVVSWISPSVAPSPIDSAAFFTRLRNTWMSWSRLASTGGSDGS